MIFKALHAFLPDLPLTENKEILEGADLDAWNLSTTPQQWAEMGRLLN